MWLQNLQKALRANNWSSLAKDETSGPFVVTCSSVRKNDEKKKKKNLKCYGVADPYLSECTSHFFKEIALRSF